MTRCLCFCSAALLAFALVFSPVAADQTSKPKFQILDGSPRTIVCITNSHGGGRMLDQKLKRYFNGKSPITVRFAGGWSTPVDPRTGAVEQGSWLTRFSLEKEKAAGHPVIVIALSGVAMPRPARRGEPVPVNDKTVEVGVATLARFVEALKSRGADEVFVSTYHYFDLTANQSWREQYDNDFTLKVFADFNRKTGDHLGIDCLTPTRKHHPLTVGDDQFHPSKLGHLVYSHCWFEALLRHDGREVPAWSQQELDAALERERQDRKAKN